MSKNAKSKKSEVPQQPPTAESLPLASASRQPSAAMVAMFAAPEGTTIKKLTLPPVIKPGDMVKHPNVIISGEITGVIKSPVSTYNSKLLLMRHHTGAEFAFPLTAVVARALAKYHDEEADPKKFDFSRCIGQRIAIRGLGATTTQDGQRPVNLFEVGVVE